MADFMPETEVLCGGVDRAAERFLSEKALPTQTGRVEDEHLFKLSLVTVGGRLHSKDKNRTSGRAYKTVSKKITN